MYDDNEVVYSICIKDIQNVAEQELGRELLNEEIERIIDKVVDNINWYDAISDAIYPDNEISALSIDS